jgi:hypothetical protein
VSVVTLEPLAYSGVRRLPCDRAHRPRRTPQCRLYDRAGRPPFIVDGTGPVKQRPAPRLPADGRSRLERGAIMWVRR